MGTRARLGTLPTEKHESTVAGFAVTVVSIHGDGDDPGLTRNLLRQAFAAISDMGGFQVVGADWNATVEEVTLWIE